MTVSISLRTNRVLADVIVLALSERICLHIQQPRVVSAVHHRGVSGVELRTDALRCPADRPCAIAMDALLHHHERRVVRATGALRHLVEVSIAECTACNQFVDEPVSARNRAPSRGQARVLQPLRRSPSGSTTSSPVRRPPADHLRIARQCDKTAMITAGLQRISHPFLAGLRAWWLDANVITPRRMAGMNRS